MSKYIAIKAYWREEVNLHTFLTFATGGLLRPLVAFHFLLLYINTHLIILKSSMNLLILDTNVINVIKICNKDNHIWCKTNFQVTTSTFRKRLSLKLRLFNGRLKTYVNLVQSFLNVFHNSWKTNTSMQ
jgi:hypothetical protein